MLRDGKIIGDNGTSMNAFNSDEIIVYMCDTHIRLDIEIEIGLDWILINQSKVH